MKTFVCSMCVSGVGLSIDFLPKRKTASLFQFNKMAELVGFIKIMVLKKLSPQIPRPIDDLSSAGVDI